MYRTVKLAGERQMSWAKGARFWLLWLASSLKWRPMPSLSAQPQEFRIDGHSERDRIGGMGQSVGLVADP